MSLNIDLLRLILYLSLNKKTNRTFKSQLVATLNYTHLVILQGNTHTLA